MHINNYLFQVNEITTNPLIPRIYRGTVLITNHNGTASILLRLIKKWRPDDTAEKASVIELKEMSVPLQSYFELTNKIEQLINKEDSNTDNTIELMPARLKK